jgi:aminopeptidase YwaD
VRQILVALVGLSTFATSAQQSPAHHLPPLDRVLPSRAEAIYAVLNAAIDPRVAVETVTFMSPLWRLAGNPEYDRSLDFVRQRLSTASMDVRVEEFENSGHGWEQQSGTLRIDGPTGEVVLSRERDRVALCINSFPTPAGGVTLRVIHAGSGTRASDYESKDVKGALVIGSGAVGQLWTRAVKERGAAGVVSTDIAAYTRPDDTPDVLQWASIPYDDTLRSFAFKATKRAGDRDPFSQSS